MLAEQDNLRRLTSPISPAEREALLRPTIGSATAKRAAPLNTFVREEGKAGWRGILDESLRWARLRQPNFLNQQ